MRKANAVSAGLLFTASLLGAAPPSESQVLGTWVAVQRSTGGLGSMVTFMPGGKLEMSFGAIVESWYEIKGDQLTEPSGTNAPPTVMRFRIEGNTLHEQSGSQPEIRLLRVGRTGTMPIVGVWRPESQMTAASVLEQAKKGGQKMDAQTAQATADLFNNRTIEYTADGLTKIRLPMQKTAGSYDLAAQTFTAGDASGRFRLENGLLIVSDGKKDRAFVRSEASKEQLKRAGVRYGDAPAELDRAHH
jgi:hypothetical protein